MKRKALHFFFLAAQFGLLAISIPKVARLFFAYDGATVGWKLGGIDLGSWIGGAFIDAIVAVTTAASMRKYEETGNRWSLLPSVVVILPCIGFSMVANYEDAALKNPAQYAHISIFTFPALVLNPLMLSLLPIIVLLLIVMIPSVLAQTRIKTATEIEAEAARKLVQIEAKKRIRNAQAAGWKATLQTVTSRTQELPENAPLPDPEVHIEQPAERALPPPSTRATKAMWDAMSLKERVAQSGLITPTEVAEVLGVGAQHARRLVKDVRTSDNEQHAVKGRMGVNYQALIDDLYTRRTKDSFAQAQKLERALGLKKTRSLHVVGDAGDHPTMPLIGDENAESVS